MIFAVFDMGCGVPAAVLDQMVEASDLFLKIFNEAWGYLPDVVVDGVKAGYDPTKKDFGVGDKAAAQIVPVYIFSSPDVPYAGGYHDKDPQGRAYCKVFSDPYIQNGGTWTKGNNSVLVALTHEIGETRGDYPANGWYLMPDGRFTAEETADAVEDTYFAVLLENGDTASVTNFLLPNWGDEGSQGPYDYLKVLTAPFTKTSGGYWIVMDKDGNVSQEFGTAMAEWRKDLKRKSHRFSQRA